MSIEIKVFSVYGRLIKKHPVSFLVGLILYLVVFSFFYTKSQSEKKSTTTSKFHSTVASEITTILGTEQDVEQLSDKVHIIFNSYDRKSNGALSEYGIVNFLEDVYATQPDVITDSNKSASVIALIAKQKEKDPYYGLRFEQKVIIQSLEDKTHSPTSSTGSISYIEEIKEVVRRQNVEIDELKKSNNLGIPIGFAGIGLTVIFGIIGLIYPFTRKQKSKKKRESETSKIVNLLSQIEIASAKVEGVVDLLASNPAPSERQEALEEIEYIANEKRLHLVLAQIWRSFALSGDTNAQLDKVETLEWQKIYDMLIEDPIDTKLYERLSSALQNDGIIDPHSYFLHYLIDIRLAELRKISSRYEIERDELLKAMKETLIVAIQEAEEDPDE